QRHDAAADGGESVGGGAGRAGAGETGKGLRRFAATRVGEGSARQRSPRRLGSRRNGDPWKHESMSDPFTTVIGLEVHVQLLTRTKLFCGCANKFGLPPNSATCPVCLGLPGVLPVMNRTAFDLALKAALALNCHIAGYTKWDRKNYYYP